MIKILNKGGLTYPIFVCDVCNKKINNLGLAAAIFQRSEIEGEVQNVLHVHKNACQDKGEKKLGGIAPWQELQDHVILLIGNSGGSLAGLTERQEDLGPFGLL
nr:hypothetical protein [Dyella sp. ASV24]